jgi:hypothetical protein
MPLDIAGHHLLQVCSQESQEMDEAPKGTVLSIYLLYVRSTCPRILGMERRTDL